MAFIHSFESFGTVDGPGVRFIVFTQGCPMRCKYCHNPDTWKFNEGKKYDVHEVRREILKYKNYIKKGGVTVSGGEPLVQIDFLIELFTLLKEDGIHTCVDTAGAMFDKNNPVLLKKYEQLLSLTDLFIVDIKHIEEASHIDLTGISMKRPHDFIRYLSDNQKDMWIRVVLVDGYTNDENVLKKIRNFIDSLNNVLRVEVLPYHTMGINKYEQMGIEYPFKNMKRPSKESIDKAKEILGAFDYVK